MDENKKAEPQSAESALEHVRKGSNEWMRIGDFDANAPHEGLEG